jgi:Lar family restriction alleviation protein
MTDDLKPCPFCGEKYVTTEFDRGQGDKWGYASCDVCAACGPEVRTNYDREPDGPWHSEAIAAWNTRALPAIDPAAIREAAWMEALDAAHQYTLTQYGMGFLKHPVDRERILAVLAELEGEKK